MYETSVELFLPAATDWCKLWAGCERLKLMKGQRIDFFFFFSFDFIQLYLVSLSTTANPVSRPFFRARSCRSDELQRLLKQVDSDMAARIRVHDLVNTKPRLTHFAKQASCLVRQTTKLLLWSATKTRWNSYDDLCTLWQGNPSRNSWEWTKNRKAEKMLGW